MILWHNAIMMPGGDPIFPTLPMIYRDILKHSCRIKIVRHEEDGSIYIRTYDPTNVYRGSLYLLEAGKEAYTNYK